MSRSLLVFVFDADPDIPELIELLQSKYGAVTATRFEFESPIVPVPAWWETLSNKSKLRTVRDATVWRDSTKTIKHSVVKAGDASIQYWGRIENGMLCVLDRPTLKLWISPGDVELIA